MKLIPRKITFQVFYDQLDDNGHLIAEPIIHSKAGENGQPESLVLYAHQFSDLEKKIKELADPLEQQLSSAPPSQLSHVTSDNSNGNDPAPANRAQRRTRPRR